MVAELNEIWGIDNKCDKIMEHIKNCQECQKKLQKMMQKSQQPQKSQQQPQQQVVEQFQVQPKQKIQKREEEVDLIDKFFEYSDVILIGLTIYLILKAL